MQRRKFLLPPELPIEQKYNSVLKTPFQELGVSKGGGPAGWQPSVFLRTFLPGGYSEYRYRENSGPGPFYDPQPIWTVTDYGTSRVQGSAWGLQIIDGCHWLHLQFLGDHMTLRMESRWLHADMALLPAYLSVPCGISLYLLCCPVRRLRTEGDWFQVCTYVPGI